MMRGSKSSQLRKDVDMRSEIPPPDAAKVRVNRDATVSVYDAVALTGYGERAIRDAVKRGDIAAVRLGRNIRVLSEPLRRQFSIDRSDAARED